MFRGILPAVYAEGKATKTTFMPSSPHIPSWLRKLILVPVLVPALLWLVATTWLWRNQERLLFAPEVLMQDHAFTQTDTTEEWVKVPGARLHAVHLRQPLVNGQRHTKGIVFYLHGNAGNVATWYTNHDFWLHSGYDLFMLDYRGFGKSNGHIESEAQLHDDVMRAWSQIEPEYAGLKHVIFGRSLGTGLATHLAMQVRSDLLVLVSPYQSIESMAKAHYPWIPAFVLRYPLHTDQWLPQVSSRIVLFHGDQDAVIPISHSQALLREQASAQLIQIDGAGHGDIQNFPDYTQKLSRLLETL